MAKEETWQPYFLVPQLGSWASKNLHIQYCQWPSDAGATTLGGP
jgi:hypothetical protein